MAHGHLPYTVGDLLLPALPDRDYHIHPVAGDLFVVPDMQNKTGDSADLPDVGEAGLVLHRGREC